MMNRVVLVFALGALVLAAGCSDSASEGPLSATERANAQPKTVDQLPADMPADAKSAAGAGAGAANMAQQQGNDPARVKAMQEMQKQRGG